MSFINRVIPSKEGIQKNKLMLWFPASAGMTQGASGLPAIALPVRRSLDEDGAMMGRPTGDGVRSQQSLGGDAYEMGANFVSTSGA